MSEQPAPERMEVLRSPEARGDIRAIDRKLAMTILGCVDHFLASGAGDVKKLKPPRMNYRLRCGDCRLFFDYAEGHRIEITSVRHRKDAYR